MPFTNTETNTAARAENGAVWTFTAGGPRPTTLKTPRSVGAPVSATASSGGVMAWFSSLSTTQWVVGGILTAGVLAGAGVGIAAGAGAFEPAATTASMFKPKGQRSGAAAAAGRRLQSDNATATAEEYSEIICDDDFIPPLADVSIGYIMLTQATFEKNSSGDITDEIGTSILYDWKTDNEINGIFNFDDPHVFPPHYIAANDPVFFSNASIDTKEQLMERLTRIKGGIVRRSAVDLNTFGCTTAAEFDLRDDYTCGPANAIIRILIGDASQDTSGQSNIGFDIFTPVKEFSASGHKNGILELQKDIDNLLTSTNHSGKNCKLRARFELYNQSGTVVNTLPVPKFISQGTNPDALASIHTPAEEWKLDVRYPGYNWIWDSTNSLWESNRKRYGGDEMVQHLELALQEGSMANKAEIIQAMNDHYKDDANWATNKAHIWATIDFEAHGSVFLNAFTHFQMAIAKAYKGALMPNMLKPSNMPQSIWDYATA